MIYQVAEKFKSLQGEGVYAGTPMAFIRFVGCSVGKRICTYCDTDFDKTYEWRGGGQFTEQELLQWAGNYDHICLTGGEPLDQDLTDFVRLAHSGRTIHIETSGTKYLNDWLHALRPALWVCVSPKPGFIEDVVMGAQEVKVIVPGLGDRIPQRLNATSMQLAEDIKNPPRWPTLEDALRWAAAGKIVFLQPRNAKHDIDAVNLKYVLDLLAQYPTLRLSVQMHKVLRVQ